MILAVHKAIKNTSRAQTHTNTHTPLSHVPIVLAHPVPVQACTVIALLFVIH